MKNAILSAILLLVSLLAAVGVAEVVLRVKNSNMQNYDIEMWRYAADLKVRSDNPLLGHEHVPSRQVVLQSVTIRTNEYGLRGDRVPPATADRRRILFLGGSVTLGWGVEETKTVTARVEQMFRAAGENVEVLNAGIGNYNAPRYVERFLTRLGDLQPTDIVVHYFLRDAETLDAGGGNVVLRNSQLAVTMWIAFTRYFNASGEQSIEDHYRTVYEPTAPGFIEMKKQLARLADYARTRHVRLYLAMVPDVHDLTNYRLEFVHDRMRQVARELGYHYVDLLPVMRNLTPAEVWSMPGDPHPNALGHERMAQAIYPALQLSGDAGGGGVPQH
jgi:lysophospholipase L1-like esterase